MSIAIARTPGCTSRGSKPTGALLELRGDVALGVDLDEQDALAALAASSAVAAATVLLPTPPLPVKKSRRRSSRSGAGPDHARSLERLPDAEADLALAGVARDLDVRDLVGRDADLRPFVSVSHSMLVALPATRVLDRLRRPARATSSISSDELASGVDDSDADFHCAARYPGLSGLGPIRFTTILSSVR